MYFGLLKGGCRLKIREILESTTGQLKKYN
jgi:hypothetical protein